MKTSIKGSTRITGCKTFCFSAVLLLAIIFSFGSCALRSSNTAVIWTDRPEFAFYAEFFNASQNRYKVEVRYFEFPALRLTEPGDHPDIVIASWLKSATVRGLFRPLDRTFGRNGLSRDSFYPRLLSLGHIDRRQYLLPVSFNIPAIVFARDFSRPPSDFFTMEMEEIKERGRAFNVEARGAYTRMGFSPSFDDDFLFIVTTLFGASFREAAPIAWDDQALDASIRWVQRWISEANTSIQMEEDFIFRYFHEPPDRLVNSGRILFTYMNSSRFFTLPEERRANLDFRWIASNEMIPLYEWDVFLGIHRRTRARGAAEAFTKWFFNDETQRLLLEAKKNKRLHETSFGIAGGFSAMRTVTEQVFPQFYPDLLGHIPPESFLSPPNILPRNWMLIKERVIIPYIRDRIRHQDRTEVRTLERRVAEWHRLHRI